jgi:hypothetical protein
MWRCGRIGGFFLVTGLAIAPTAAKAAEGGIFCKGAMSFIERLEPNRAMSFKVMGADERQHIISVEGVAIPQGVIRRSPTATRTNAARSIFFRALAVL